MLPCLLFSNRSPKASKYGKNISETLDYASCGTFLFLPNFNVICDLLLNRHTETWNLFVKQLDLTLTLDLLADRWKVKFNPAKCEVMRISHDTCKDKSCTWYQISGTELRNVSYYKDPGVIIASDLKWSKHVEQIIHKVNKVLSLLNSIVGGKNKGILF